MLRAASIVAGVGLAASLFAMARAEVPPPAPAGATASGAAHRDRGDALYGQLCSPCHGLRGTGAGPAAPWLWPRPRDFTRGDYEWRTTHSGLPPTDDDLELVIRHGIPGTSMPGFDAVLTDRDLDAIIGVLKSFAPAKFRRTAEVIDEPALPPPASREREIEHGRAAFARLGCIKCHGEKGRGDGPSSAELVDSAGRSDPPYDLTTEPLRRPRAPGEDAVLGIYRTLVTGLSGTPMPSYEGAAPPDELVAVAIYVDSIRHRGGDARSYAQRVSVSRDAVALDRKEHLARAGLWPGGEGAQDGDAAVWSRALRVNGKPPASLTPAQSSLSAKQCARCHPSQYRQWRGSIHAHAGSPGLIGQLLPMQAHGQGASIESCQRCHAPLAEQLPLIRGEHLGRSQNDGAYRKNPFYQPALREQGVTCASCHVRNWVRHGPPPVAGSKLASVPSYPFVETPLYERGDFCLGCHQLPPRLALNGRPLLNTYREWLEGPYMRRGVQCQHCHMSSREHEWKGVHDPDTFRQGIGVEVVTRRTSKGVSARVRVRNRGAGHYLPTTPTPAAWVTVELVDGDGRAIRGARTEKRIGRHLAFRDGHFVELEDTRIPPGEAIEVAGGWTGGRTAAATGVRVRIRVHPDDYYEGFYRKLLADPTLPAAERPLMEAALRRGTASHYVAFDRTYPIEGSGGAPRPR